MKSGHCDYYKGECCTQWLIGDGTCDEQNNFLTCNNHDGGDCRPPNIKKWPKCPYNPQFIGDGVCVDHFKTKPECNYDGLDCCPNCELVGNGECNLENLNDLCMNDGGDCCHKEIGPGNKERIKCFNTLLFF